MITSRALQNADIAALERLLLGAPQYNVFHLSVLSEVGLGGSTWAVGVFLDGNMVGAVMASRGTGGVYTPPPTSRSSTPWQCRARTLNERQAGASQRRTARSSTPSCHWSGCLSAAGWTVAISACSLARHRRPRTRRKKRLLPAPVSQFAPRNPQWRSPRMAVDADMERLIDFYLPGFYSLARLPNREAWRDRLSDQLVFRTLVRVSKTHEGRVVSAALSSAEGGGAAMLGGGGHSGRIPWPGPFDAVRGRVVRGVICSRRAISGLVLPKGDNGARRPRIFAIKV